MGPVAIYGGVIASGETSEGISFTKCSLIFCCHGFMAFLSMVFLEGWKKALVTGLVVPFFFPLIFLLFALPSELLENEFVATNPLASIVATTAVPKILSMTVMISLGAIFKNNNVALRNADNMEQGGIHHGIMIKTAMVEYLSKYMAFEQVSATEVAVSFFFQGCIEVGIKLYEGRKVISTFRQLEVEAIQPTSRYNLVRGSGDESTNMLPTSVRDDQATLAVPQLKRTQTAATENMEVDVAYHSLVEYCSIVTMGYVRFLRGQEKLYSILEMCAVALGIEMLFNVITFIALAYFMDIRAHRGLTHRPKAFVISEGILVLMFLMTGLFPSVLPGNDWFQ
eukprot:gnl/MRDRNA2_/MRDRNA2_66035_c0_seq1.p1 gnl/MRDRNA2_/MRDRNA2_66035_c0~~gnl/MRDRNA2_/MRDRNA2_66035_c0_seq1.p1  ORF type:complete len:392 (+),score=26.32 gnl/MRDRNA2_/MRDRNA2_66035_c0_seq1:160-1176(+)